MTDLKRYFDDQRQAMVDFVTTLVNYESFSNDKPRVDALGNWLCEQFTVLGADNVQRFPQIDVGDMALATWNSNAPGKPIMFMVHIDTVWPAGTLAQRPVRIDDDGRLYGPGAIDMKAGITIMLNAIRGLRERDEMPQRPIWVLMTTDEEIGSLRALPLIQEFAPQTGLVLVMEPGTRDGALKTQRKGVASYALKVQGRASHAGNAPEEGINAIIELAQQALDLHQLNDLKYGTSVSVTMVQGGTASNVIPDYAEAKIDTRTLTVKAFEKLDQQIKQRVPFMPGAEVTIESGHYRPPMERNDAVVEQVKAIGAQVGVTVREDSVGGGSDGNHTAAMGIPTVDGLGGQGDGLHALHEHVLINSMPERATLVAGLLRDWQD